MALELALALWAKAAEQAHSHGADGTKSAEYQFRFLSKAEVATIQRYAAIMIPAGDRSGGAAAARVETYFDHTLAIAAASLQRTWRAGLAEWGKSTKTQAVLDAAVKNEFAPRTRQDQFFVLFKTALTAAFYTSEEGIRKELGYQGMGFLREFPGYQGEEFRTPADYKPLLRARS